MEAKSGHPPKRTETEIARENMTQISQFLISHGGLFLFVMALAEESGLPLPAAPWLLAAGALAAGGKLSFLASTWWAALGSLAGDMIWFYLGQRGKRRIFRLFPHLESVKRTIPRRLHVKLVLRGVRILTAAKFIPFGTVVSLRAGALEVGSLRFLLIDALSSVLYVGVYIALGFTFHSQLEQVVAFVGKLGVVALVLLVIAFATYASWALLKGASKQTHQFSQSRLQSQIDDSTPATTTGRPIKTPSLTQTTKSPANT
jgi:membrane protein DedA with SNARE-associated domain